MGQIVGRYTEGAAAEARAERKKTAGFRKRAEEAERRRAEAESSAARARSKAVGLYKLSQFTHSLKKPCFNP
jgi:hypothetical protein